VPRVSEFGRRSRIAIPALSFYLPGVTTNHEGTMSTTQNEAIQLHLSPTAQTKVREFFTAEPDLPQETAGLRIAVMPGGCSGFKYEMSIDDAPATDDLVLDTDGIRVFVDPFSAQYLNGVKLDYISTMQTQGFTFENPNASGGCGCGTSFSV
jgi:iron-sulfur cluster assembly accessory protein